MLLSFIDKWTVETPPIQQSFCLLVVICFVCHLSRNRRLRVQPSFRDVVEVACVTGRLRWGFGRSTQAHSSMRREKGVAVQPSTRGLYVVIVLCESQMARAGNVLVFVRVRCVVVEALASTSKREVSPAKVEQNKTSETGKQPGLCSTVVSFGSTRLMGGYRQVALLSARLQAWWWMGV